MLVARSPTRPPVRNNQVANSSRGPGAVQAVVRHDAAPIGKGLGTANRASDLFVHVVPNLAHCRWISANSAPLPAFCIAMVISPRLPVRCFADPNVPPSKSPAFIRTARSPILCTPRAECLPMFGADSTQANFPAAEAVSFKVKQVSSCLEQSSAGLWEALPAFPVCGIFRKIALRQSIAASKRMRNDWRRDRGHQSRVRYSRNPGDFRSRAPDRHGCCTVIQATTANGESRAGLRAVNSSLCEDIVMRKFTDGVSGSGRGLWIHARSLRLHRGEWCEVRCEDHCTRRQHNERTSRDQDRQEG